MHGRYTVSYANGDSYSGDIRADKHEGCGKLTLNNGGCYDGMFKNHKLDGAVRF